MGNALLTYAVNTETVIPSKGLIAILLMTLLFSFQCDAIEGYGAKLGKVSVFLIAHLFIFATFIRLIFQQGTFLLCP